ncbi:MAG TPA: hypothetical protein DDW89_00800 [Gammaproteobacteria bacterium]|nr:hypothetical protein [Gammaproteobacteria bacterium]
MKAMTVEQVRETYKCDDRMAQVIAAMSTVDGVAGFKAGRVEGFLFVEVDRPFPRHRKTRGIWINTKRKSVHFVVGAGDDVTSAFVDRLARAVIAAGMGFVNVQSYFHNFKYLAMSGDYTAEFV